MATQGGLFDLPSDCERGRHEVLVDAPPIFYKDCVNILRKCPRCGEVIIETSWDRAAYEKKFGVSSVVSQPED